MSQTSVLVAVVSALAALTTGVVTYLVARRQTSGRIVTSDAAVLWAESQNMRGDMRAEIVGLRQELADVRTESRGLREDLAAAREETRKLRDELRVLRGKLERLEANGG